MPSDDAPSLADLAAIMARLRDPETGCEWDRVQTFDTIAPYTIEEAYEVADAIRRVAMVNYARHLGVNPETALREATARFETRFRKVEELADKPLKEMNIDELEALWQRAKSEL